MNPSMEAYERLLAAQRFVSVEEQVQRDLDHKRDSEARRVKRKLMKVY